MIVRGLRGIGIGIAYGFLVSVVVFLLTRIGLDKTPSGVIPFDPVALAWLAVVISGFIAGVSAAFVGAVVGMARLGKRMGATVGFFTGLLVCGLVSMNSWSGPPPRTLHDWIALLVTIAILPIGLALTGTVVAIVTERNPV